MKNLIEGLDRVIRGDSEEEGRVDLEALGEVLDEAAKTEETIKALGETDYKDKDAYFKMVQLLKGLAVASEEDETAKEYLSAVSDALTKVTKEVLGEDTVEESYGAPSNRDSSGWKKYFSGIFKDALNGKALQYIVANVKMQLPDLTYQDFKVSGSILRVSNFLADRIKEGSMVTVELVLATSDRNLSRKQAEEV